jgi:hypothetical protein
MREATSAAKQEHVVFVSLVREYEDRSLTNTPWHRTPFHATMIVERFAIKSRLMWDQDNLLELLRDNPRCDEFYQS